MKYIRICAVLLAILALFTALAGCDPWVTESSANRNPGPDSYYEEQEETKADNGFSDDELFVMEHIGYDGCFDYYRDTITDVIYPQYDRDGMRKAAGGLTVMLDPETGLPLTYTRYMELASQQLVITP